MNYFKIEICKASGEVILTENFASELSAQNHFDFLSEIKYPLTYKGISMNLTEYFTGGNKGFVRLRVENQHGTFIRRELFRNA